MAEASVRAGVVTAAEVNGPMTSSTSTKWFDLSSPSTWAVLFFLGAVFYLVVL